MAETKEREKKKRGLLIATPLFGAGRATTPYTVRLDGAEKNQNQDDDQDRAAGS
jgi:hypothetical protein